MCHQSGTTQAVPRDPSLWHLGLNGRNGRLSSAVVTASSMAVTKLVKNVDDNCRTYHETMQTNVNYI
jgi:hypothetical protein